MPVYLVFLQVAKWGLQIALCGPNVPALLEDAMFLIVQVFANLLKPNCLKIFIYQADNIVSR